MAKIFYFVRHGETEGNINNQFQLPTSPLSEKGKSEANLLAERFASIPVDVILTSSMARASETARIIGKKIKLAPIENKLFEEIKRPSVIRGRSKDDIEVKAIMKEVREHFTDPNWHYSDEENYFSLRERAEKALEFLLQRKEESVLVVTHGVFYRMIISVMTFGKDLTPTISERIKKTFIPFNTGISKIKYDLSIGYNDSGWYILTWNDHAHLGEVK